MQQLKFGTQHNVICMVFIANDRKYRKLLDSVLFKLPHVVPHADRSYNSGTIMVRRDAMKGPRKDTHVISLVQLMDAQFHILCATCSRYGELLNDVKKSTPLEKGMIAW